MHITVTKEHTLFGPELEFLGVVGPEIRPHGAPKGSKKTIVWLMAKLALIGRLIIDHFGWESIYKKHCGGEGFIPKFQGHA